MKSLRKWIWLGAVSVATICSLVGLILYVMNGRTQFDPNYCTECIVTMILSMVCGVLAIGLNFLPLGNIKPLITRALTIGQYLAGFYACVSYITSNMNLIGNLAYAMMDQSGGADPPDPAVVATFMTIIVMTAITFIFALVGGIIKKTKVKEVA